jgi:hypothetical protein
MRDMFELWSLPWHALQRHLAASYEIDVAAHAFTTGTQGRLGSTTPAGTGSRSGSWLARARIHEHTMARRGQ